MTLMLDFLYERCDAPLMLQQHCEDNRLKRPRPREIGISLQRARDVRKQAIEGGLIGLRQGSLERSPSAAFLLRSAG
jgi:hypothetical protein